MGISKRNTTIYYLTELFSGLMFFMPVWVAYELQFITLSQLAIIEAIIQGSKLISELPTGAVADLLGKRISILVGRIIGVFSLYLYTTSTNFTSFVFYAVITGFGESFVSGAQEALIYDSLKQDKKDHQFQKVTSKALFIFQLSFVVAILLGGGLSLLNYKIVIYATILAYIIALIISFWYKEPKIDTQKFTLPLYFKQFTNGFHEIFKSPYIRDISLFYIGVGGVTWSAMMIFNTSLMTTIGFTTFEIGIIVAAIRLLNGGVLFGALHLNTLITKRRAYILFPVLMIICYLPGIVLTKELAIIAVAISIFCSSARWVVLSSYVNEQYTSKNRATALSTLSMFISLSVVAAALVSSPIMQAFGGVKPMFTFLGIVSLVFVLPLGLRIRKRYHPKIVTV